MIRLKYAPETVSLVAIQSGDPAAGLPEIVYTVDDLGLLEAEHREDVRAAFKRAFETLTGDAMRVAFSDELEFDVLEYVTEDYKTHVA